MESQMEEEYEERKLLMGKTRDLEARLHDMNNQASLRDKGILDTRMSADKDTLWAHVSADALYYMRKNI